MDKLESSIITVSRRILKVGLSLTAITPKTKRVVSVKVSSAVKTTSIKAEPVQFSAGETISESDIIYALTPLVSLETV